MAKYLKHLRLPEVDYPPVHPPEHHLQTLRTTSWSPTEGQPNSGFSSGEIGKVANLDFLGLISLYSFSNHLTICCSNKYL